MSDYQETITALRKARAARDTARDALHNARLHRLDFVRRASRPDLPTTSEDHRKLADKLAGLMKRLAAATAEIEALDTAIAKAQHQNHDPGPMVAERSKLQARRDELQHDVATLRDQLAKDLPTDDPRKALQHGAAQIDEQLKAARDKFDGAEKAVAGLVDTLFQGRAPQDLIAEWTDTIPILLLPVRIEIRYRSDTGVNELWVRVFPDEIAIQTHERTLTVAESAAGKAYWIALATAADDNARKVAWRALSENFGANRAAWVALQSKPSNWNQLATVGVDALVFPVPAVTKTDSWTEAPHARVMPDRFVLMAFRGGVQVHIQVGRQIEDVLTIGPVPLTDSGTSSITRDGDQRLVHDPATQWLFDFDTAVKAGLGFKVPLPLGKPQNFDQLIVLGVKLSTDETDGKALVEQLIDAHHYSKKGFALVPQGTATNNTSSEDSGYDRRDWFSDASFVTDAGANLFEEESNPDAASDGQRLAYALGIDIAPLQHVPNAGGFDHREAVAMNKALYPATLGYFLHSMVPEALDDAAIEQTRRFFTRNVCGRGPLSAIRVGNQPYGLLPASLATLRPTTRHETADERFEAGLAHVLQVMRTHWTPFLTQIPKIVPDSDAAAKLLGVMGLHPTSVDYFQRIAYSYDYLSNLASFKTESSIGDVLKMIFDGSAATAFLNTLGYRQQRDNESWKPQPLLLQLIYQHYQTRLDPRNLIDGEPLAEDRPIKPYDAAGSLNYIDWLLTNAGKSEALRTEDFGKAEKPTALLYRMLRHGLVTQSAHSISWLLLLYDIQAPELVRTRKFMNMTTALDISAWEVMQSPARAIIPGATDPTPLADFVHFPQFVTGTFARVGAPLQDIKDGLAVLKALPTARLERLLAEHVDTLSYRLDAWQTALVERRLNRLRAPAADGEPRRAGIFIGAFGYLENAAPSPTRRTRTPESRVLPEELREGRDNLFVSSSNGGYVHAPSLNHATAAAILRNGYLTHGTPDDPDKLAVNLSSRRVRRARELMQGIRNGQSIEVLLGIQFERGMHDWTTRPAGAVILDNLKPVLRKAFPIHRTRVPRGGIANEKPEIVPDYHVVNGVAIANSPDAFPLGVADMPSLSQPRIDALRAEKAALRDALDGLKDAFTSEAAYQLALGNFDRASAVVAAVANGRIPPEVEVINSSRGTDLAFTQRLVVQFDPLQVANPWPAVPLTLRASTEAPLNHWLGGLIGDPAQVRCTVAAVDDNGTVLLDGANAPIAATLSLADLGLQPIDLMQIVRPAPQAASYSELESRIRFAFLRARALGDDTITRISFSDSGSPDPAVRSFAEILPLLEELRRLVTRAKPMSGRDALPESKTAGASTDNPGNVDVAELQTRVAAIRTTLDGIFGTVAAATSTADNAGATAADIEALRQALRGTADAGIVHTFPLSASGDAAATRDALVAQGHSLAKRYTAMTKAYDDLATASAAPGTSGERQIDLLVQMAQSLLGADFRMLPRFSFINLPDIAAADGDRDTLLNHTRTAMKIPDPVREWALSSSHVRPAMHGFEMVSTLQEMLAGTALPLSVIQLPHRPADSWLGADFPVGTTIVHNTISLVQCLPQGFAPSGLQCGLIIDEWLESLPNKEEVTGITFNFDQPNSMPPQALLLAVAPGRAGHWSWDDLVAIVRETMTAAKLRAVEPDMIDKVPGLTTLTPATMAEFSTGASTVSLDYALAVPLVLAQVGAFATLAQEP